MEQLKVSSIHLKKVARQQYIHHADTITARNSLALDWNASQQCNKAVL